MLVSVSVSVGVGECLCLRVCVRVRVRVHVRVRVKGEGGRGGIVFARIHVARRYRVDIESDNIYYYNMEVFHVTCRYLLSRCRIGDVSGSTASEITFSLFSIMTFVLPSKLYFPPF